MVRVSRGQRVKVVKFLSFEAINLFMKGFSMFPITLLKVLVED